MKEHHKGHLMKEHHKGRNLQKLDATALRARYSLHTTIICRRPQKNLPGSTDDRRRISLNSRRADESALQQNNFQ